jgi:hypothetical protein
MKTLLCLFLFFITPHAQQETLKGKIFIVKNNGDVVRIALAKVMIFKFDKALSNIEVLQKTLKTIRAQTKATIDSINFSIDALRAEIGMVNSRLNILRKEEYWINESKTLEFNRLDKQYENILQNIYDHEISVKSQYVVSEYLKLPYNLIKISFSIGAYNETDSDDMGRFEIQRNKKDKSVLFVFAERRVGTETEKYIWLISIPKQIPKDGIILNNNNLIESFSENSIIKADMNIIEK